MTIRELVKEEIDTLPEESLRVVQEFVLFQKYKDSWISSRIKDEERLEDFWHHKTVEELAAEQGVGLVNDLDQLFGCGKDLWETEEEWDNFMESVQAGRKEKA